MWKNRQWEDIPLGEFFVQEREKAVHYPLNCLDRMVQLNTPVKNLITTALTTGRDLAAAIAARHHFTIRPSTQKLLNTFDTPLNTGDDGRRYDLSRLHWLLRRRFRHECTVWPRRDAGILPARRHSAGHA